MDSDTRASALTGRGSWSSGYGRPAPPSQHGARARRHQSGIASRTRARWTTGSHRGQLLAEMRALDPDARLCASRGAPAGMRTTMASPRCALAARAGRARSTRRSRPTTAGTMPRPTRRRESGMRWCCSASRPRAELAARRALRRGSSTVAPATCALRTSRVEFLSRACRRSRQESSNALIVDSDRSCSSTWARDEIVTLTCLTVRRTPQNMLDARIWEPVPAPADRPCGGRDGVPSRDDVVAGRPEAASSVSARVSSA